MLGLYGLIFAWLAQFVVAMWFAWRFPRDLGKPLSPESEPPVVVVTPVKGAGPDLPGFVARLRSFSYSDYTVVAVVESEADPAFAVLQEAARGEGAPMSVLVAGLAETEGQKNHNIRHAIAHLGPDPQIVAFVDADTLPQRDWLTRLVRPLVRDPDIAAVTGHRWIVPRGDDLPSAIVAAANASLLTLPRLWSVCWGGTLAMRRETLEAIDLRRGLSGAVVDDVLITLILHEHGLRVFTPKGLVVISPVEHSWASAFAFIRRQHMFVRFYLPGSWITALVMLTGPILAALAAAALAFTGDRLAIAVLAAAIGLGQLRVYLRARIARRLWGLDGDALNARTRFAERWLAPVWICFHAAAAWAAGWSRQIRWAGVVYEVRGRNETRILSHGGRPSESGMTT
ncbi:glycosyltransferase [uncultured Enterovirga sp.]|uniref:glycosyltransferase n=1 Tax=uncultured Enterovirga sp. TaxID=2026352 RepID=UPI0035CC4F9E